MTSPGDEITIGLRLIGAEAAVADTNRVTAAQNELTKSQQRKLELDRQVASTSPVTVRLERERAAKAVKAAEAEAAARAKTAAVESAARAKEQEQRLAQLRVEGRLAELRQQARTAQQQLSQSPNGGQGGHGPQSGQGGFWSSLVESFQQNQAQATQSISTSLQHATDQASSTAGTSGASKFWDKFKSGFAGGLGALAGLVGVGGIMDLISSSIGAYAEAQDAETKYLDAFERFPKLADTNIEKINALAAARAKLTRYDADATKGAFAQLAALRLTGTQITKLLPLVQDYAAATGKTMEQAAKDVADGFMGNSTALSEKYIGFKATGSASVDYTNMMAALNTQVGGFAEKDGKTAGAQLERLKSQFTDILVIIGGALFPMIESFGKWLDEGGAEKIEKLVNLIGKLVEAAAKIVGWVLDSDGTDKATKVGTAGWIPGNDSWVPNANGGVMPGYAPGQDTVKALLSPGEGVLVPEVVRAIGPAAVHRANAWGVQQRFAFGGIAGSDAGYMKTALEQAMQAASWQSVYQAGGATPGKNPSASPSGSATPVTAPSGGPVERWRGLATQALQMTGQYTPENLASMMTRLRDESSGDPNAINNWDRNAKNGTPSQGLMQVIQPTFDAYALPGYDKNLLDPLSNMLASINYASKTYGSLDAAYNRKKADGSVAGYDSGGWLPPGGTAVSGLDKPEAILNPDQWESMKTMANRGMDHSNSGSVVVESGAINITVMGGDEDRIIALMEAKLDPMFERLQRRHNTRSLA